MIEDNVSNEVSISTHTLYYFISTISRKFRIQDLGASLNEPLDKLNMTKSEITGFAQGEKKKPQQDIIRLVLFV